MGAIGRDELASWDRRMEDGGSITNGDGGGSITNGDGGGRSTGGKEERILVSVRLRPLSEKEIMNRDPCDWECINETTIIFRNSLPERSMFPIAYTFDKVFNAESTTRRVYEEAAKEVAISVVSGINSSIFAYGQTSSGKTYTMSGITEYSVADIYDYIQRHEERVFVLKFSAMEIYNEAVRDLLSSDSTPLRLLDDPERGTIVEKLKEETLRDCNHLKELLSLCEAQRQIGETSLNENSSRSHQILRLTIESSTCEFLGKENSSTLVAAVNFVDLAGSERASQAMSAGARLKEGCHINRSLLTLGTVIRKLSKGRNGHIPFRDSKLTRILQPSLGGNARTAIICTISPSRCHIEQSRNTLLFASCAKEVVTSANVNVVMSDKALVKQLQLELARLENELRVPCLPSNVSRAEALLKEKDIQIRKMEKEIKELMQQRDLAQSRLENLLQFVGDDQLSVSGHWENRERSVSRFRNTCEEENSISKSPISYHGVDFSITKLSTCPDSEDDIDASSDRDLDNFHKQIRGLVASRSLSIKKFNYVGALQDNCVKEDISLNNSEEFEDLCKEVHCIEMDESSTSKTNALSTRSNGLLPLSVVSSEVEEEKLVLNLERNKYPGNQVSGVADAYSSNQVPVVCTFDKQFQTSDSLDKRSLEEQSPWHLNSRSSVLSKSRSCKPSVSCNSSSPWFVDEEENQNTPPSTSLMDFFGRPQGFQRRVHALNYGAKALLGEGTQSSESRASADAPGDKILKSTSEEDISGLCDSVVGMKMMNQIQNQTPRSNDEDHEEKGDHDLGTESTMKDVAADPKNPCTSPSTWALEFEKRQQDIIVLWHDCNVSLVHRTYFFLLFKGDPADSIYLEVEFRRLTFLKQTFENEDAHKPMIEDGSIVIPASSIKALRREREMLFRKMKRRLSSMERKALYLEWGIALDSKQRRLQLARLLWSETKDMNHIRESASIIAKLVGLLEPGQALKEMFELNFTLQRTNRRWRY